MASQPSQRPKSLKNSSPGISTPPPVLPSPRYDQPIYDIPIKTPPIEVPTSPQLLVGEEMLHFSHPQHYLSKLNLADQFTCAGCKERGAGIRFTCPQCQFKLHEFCALAPPRLNNHPFHPQHSLVFYSKPAKGGISQPKCSVCHKAVKGYNFQCSSCGFLMHPCCAMLSAELNVPFHEHPLRILPPSHKAAGFVCGECREKRSGRVYGCIACNYHLHAICAKNMVNGLYTVGIRGGEKQQDALGNAGNIASQIVKGFLGGLMEGIGQGVAGAIFDDIASGSRGSK